MNPFNCVTSLHLFFEFYLNYSLLQDGHDGHRKVSRHTKSDNLAVNYLSHIITKLIIGFEDSDRKWTQVLNSGSWKNDQTPHDIHFKDGRQIGLGNQETRVLHGLPRFALGSMWHSYVKQWVRYFLLCPEVIIIFFMLNQAEHLNWSWVSKQPEIHGIFRFKSHIQYLSRKWMRKCWHFYSQE